MKCHSISNKKDSRMKIACILNEIETYSNEYGTVCNFDCPYGWIVHGSKIRRCTAIGSTLVWSGEEGRCQRISKTRKILNEINYFIL
jgi:hypothetical protein